MDHGNSKIFGLEGENSIFLEVFWSDSDILIDGIYATIHV